MIKKTILAIIASTSMIVAVYANSTARCVPDALTGRCVKGGVENGVVPCQKKISTTCATCQSGGGTGCDPAVLPCQVTYATGTGTVYSCLCEETQPARQEESEC